MSAQKLAFIDAQGWYQAADPRHSPFFNTRPSGDAGQISLLVIHCISLPEGHYGTPYVDQLFMGTLDCHAEPSFEQLKGLEVSAHFVISREGQVSQYVSCQQRAWHAGVSRFEGRENCNDFSIGIELEGTDKTPFTEAQYQALVSLTEAIMRRYPQITAERIVAHSHIAPTRKTDPGVCFEWENYLHQLALHDK